MIPRRTPRAGLLATRRLLRLPCCTAGLLYSCTSAWSDFPAAESCPDLVLLSGTTGSVTEWRAGRDPDNGGLKLIRRGSTPRRRKERVFCGGPSNTACDLLAPRAVSEGVCQDQDQDQDRLVMCQMTRPKREPLDGSTTRPPTRALGRHHWGSCETRGDGAGPAGQQPSYRSYLATFVREDKRRATSGADVYVCGTHT